MGTLRAETERVADVSDRASAEEQACTDEAIRMQLKRTAMESAAPREDGDCACGCGAEVEPARLALGYGRTLICQERLELNRRNRAR